MEQTKHGETMIKYDFLELHNVRYYDHKAKMGVWWDPAKKVALSLQVCTLENE
jgi:hypothetical protein